MKKNINKILLFIMCLALVTLTSTVYASGKYDDEYIGDDFCNLAGTKAGLNVLSWILLILRLMIPIIIIFRGTLDVYKIVISGETKDILPAAKSLGCRIVIGVFIFFIPTLIKSCIGYLLPESYDACAQCLLRPGECTGEIIPNTKNSQKGSTLDDWEYQKNMNQNNNEPGSGAASSAASGVDAGKYATTPKE